MVTDDERREVAAAFRRYREETTNREFASLFDVFDACGLTYYDGVVLYDRLADLIDPGESFKCVAKIDVDEERLKELAYKAAVECTGVDREALLALADEIRGLVKNQEIRFFHVVQVHESTLVTIENRIREACGEVGR